MGHHGTLGSNKSRQTQIGDNNYFTIWANNKQKLLPVG